eukprot:scaffold6131_cov72-Attheya_sp.AAC.5
MAGIHILDGVRKPDHGGGKGLTLRKRHSMPCSGKNLHIHWTGASDCPMNSLRNLRTTYWML